MAVGLERAVLAIEGDPGFSVGVLSSSAPGTFSAGADLNHVARGDGDRLSTARGGFGGITRLPRTKPLIAAVNGNALAGGFELALACDLIIAERSARFGLPEVTRGLIANGGGLVRLPTLLPPAIAADVILTGRILSAEEALRYGVASRLVDDGSARTTALAVAQTIAENSQLAVAASMRVFRSVVGVSDVVWDLCAEAARSVRASRQAVDAAQRFVSHDGGTDAG